jgi:hypothetical protein
VRRFTASFFGFFPFGVRRFITAFFSLFLYPARQFPRQNKKKAAMNRRIPNNPICRSRQTLEIRSRQG